MDESFDGHRKTVSLHFAGGSIPERAHGIVYAGSMEESILEQDSSTVEASYFGFITASQDETLEQARRKVVAPSRGRWRWRACISPVTFATSEPWWLLRKAGKAGPS